MHSLSLSWTLQLAISVSYYYATNCPVVKILMSLSPKLFNYSRADCPTCGILRGLCRVWISAGFIFHSRLRKNLISNFSCLAFFLLLTIWEFPLRLARLFIYIEISSMIPKLQERKTHVLKSVLLQGHFHLVLSQDSKQSALTGTNLFLWTAIHKGNKEL